MPSELGWACPAAYQDVRCPMCGSNPGEKCRSRSSRYTKEINYAHAARVAESRDTFRRLQRHLEARCAIVRRRANLKEDTQ